MASPDSPGPGFTHRKKSDYSIDRTVSEVDPKVDAENALPGELISAGSQHLHRKLGGKEIQLLAVGGAIGTCMTSRRESFSRDAS